jgi:hypothetical protein
MRVQPISHHYVPRLLTTRMGSTDNDAARINAQLAASGITKPSDTPMTPPFAGHGEAVL